MEISAPERCETMGRGGPNLPCTVGSGRGCLGSRRVAGVAGREGQPPLPRLQNFLHLLYVPRLGVGLKKARLEAVGGQGRQLARAKPCHIRQPEIVVGNVAAEEGWAWGAGGGGGGGQGGARVREEVGSGRRGGQRAAQQRAEGRSQPPPSAPGSSLFTVTTTLVRRSSRSFSSRLPANTCSLRLLSGHSVMGSRVRSRWASSSGSSRQWMPWSTRSTPRSLIADQM